MVTLHFVIDKRIDTIFVKHKFFYLYLPQLIVILALTTTTLVAHAQEKTCPHPPQQVTFKAQTIFDENEPSFMAIHRWANAIHIDTKQLTLQNEAAFFLNKCNKTPADMAELERHLRKQKYLRDAKVTRDETTKNITVTTWDNWSLMPTISFGRKGGESTYSLGIKDRNLLGLGIDADIAIYKNSQRKGYRLKSTIPLFSTQNIDLKVRFADNNDGTQRSMFLQKHFASFYTNRAYQFGFNEEERHDTIYQNSSILAIFAHQLSYITAEYAWLSFNSEHQLVRYRLGITKDQHTFNYTNNPNSALLPQNRDFIYPWIALDYIEKNFKKLSNIHLISQIEDFNHGWQVSSRLAVSDGKKENNLWFLLQAQLSKGFELHDNALLLMNAEFNTEIYHQQAPRSLIKIYSEYFYHINNNWGLYLNNANVFSKNQYLDQPISMGGNTGLRGFPLQYQHGKHSIKFTSEIRYYPYINLFKLFDLGGAAFLDAGSTLGDTTSLGVKENITDNWLYSVGIGVRLYSPHSTGNHQVIHIDFAFPQSNSADINNVEISIAAKQSF